MLYIVFAFELTLKIGILMQGFVDNWQDRLYSQEVRGNIEPTIDQIQKTLTLFFGASSNRITAVLRSRLRGYIKTMRVRITPGIRS